MVLQASGDCLSAREDVLKSSEGEGPIMLSINATQSYTVISFLYSTCSTRYKLIFNKKKRKKKEKGSGSWFRRLENQNRTILDRTDGPV